MTPEPDGSRRISFGSYPVRFTAMADAQRNFTSSIAKAAQAMTFPKVRFMPTPMATAAKQFAEATEAVTAPLRSTFLSFQQDLNERLVASVRETLKSPAAQLVEGMKPFRSIVAEQAEQHRTLFRQLSEQIARERAEAERAKRRADVARGFGKRHRFLHYVAELFARHEERKAAEAEAKIAALSVERAHVHRQMLYAVPPPPVPVERQHHVADAEQLAVMSLTAAAAAPPVVSIHRSSERLEDAA